MFYYKDHHMKTTYSTLFRMFSQTIARLKEKSAKAFTIFFRMDDYMCFSVMRDRIQHTHVRKRVSIIQKKTVKEEEWRQMRPKHLSRNVRCVSLEVEKAPVSFNRFPQEKNAVTHEFSFRLDFIPRQNLELRVLGIVSLQIHLQFKKQQWHHQQWRCDNSITTASAWS